MIILFFPILSVFSVFLQDSQAGWNFLTIPCHNFLLISRNSNRLGKVATTMQDDLAQSHFRKTVYFTAFQIF